MTGSVLNFDNVLARTAYSNLTAVQVAKRQREMMSTQVQSFDAAFSGRTQVVSSGTSAAGTSESAWLNGMGAQFAAHSNGLSGEQRTENHGKVCLEASHRNSWLLLTVNRND